MYIAKFYTIEKKQKTNKQTKTKKQKKKNNKNKDKTKQNKKKKNRAFIWHQRDLEFAQVWTYTEVLAFKSIQ